MPDEQQKFAREKLQKQREDQKAAAAGGSKSKKKHKIDNVNAALMIATAIFFDIIIGFISLLNFLLPPLGTILSAPIIVVGYATILLWLTIKGVRLLTAKKLVAMGLGSIVALIPVLPGITTLTIMTVVFDRTESLYEITRLVIVGCY
jgi:hypothetical protein